MDPEVISALISTSSGDLRRAITYLQSASRLSSSTTPPTTITVSDIQEIAGVVPTADINNFARSLGVESELDMDVDTDANKTSRFELIKRQVKLLMRNGYSASQILSQVRMKWYWVFMTGLIKECLFTVA
jgi:replication factor C subunit 2/4